MIIEAWSNNWQARVHSIIHNLGYQDAYHFVTSNNRQSFGEMFRALRESADPDDRRFLAFAHLEVMYYIDAHNRGQLRKAVMEALVRSLCQCMRSGWGRKVRERRVQVRMNWPVPTLIANCPRSFEEWTAIQDHVINEIESIGLPDEWCPEDSQDPIIQEVFRRAWPAEDAMQLPTDRR